MAISPIGPQIESQPLNDNFAYLNERVRDIAISIRDFGTVGSGVIDDTAVIQAAINYCTANNLPLLIPRGNYVVSKQGDFTLQGYALTTEGYVFLINSPLTIICEGTFKINLSTRANIFVFQNTESCFISGVKAEGSNLTVHDLYNSAIVLFNQCTNSWARDLEAKDMGHCALSIACKDVEIDNCFSYRSDTSVQNGAHFGIYGSENCVIRNSTGYGGTGDGDISLFGGGRANKVEGCKLYGYKFKDATKTIVNTGLQGICVDSGQYNGTVINNFVYGYYYGIDVKTNLDGCIVSNNTVTQCKVGIAVRRGEGNAETLNVQIVSNNVIPNGGNGNTTPIVNEYAVHAIYLQDAWGVLVDGNMLKNDIGVGTQDFCGITITYGGGTGDESYKAGVIVTSNKFVFRSILGSTGQKSLAYPIYITGSQPVLNIVVDGNTFEMCFGDNGVKPILYCNNAQRISISDNVVSDNHRALIFELTSVRQITVTGNVCGENFGFIKATTCGGGVINSNFIGNNSGNVPQMEFIDTSRMNITGNNYRNTSGGFADAEFVKATGTCDWYVISSNLALIKNKSSSNWLDIAVVTNQVVANNLVD